MKICKLGQSGIKIEIDNKTILIDPYLSNSVGEKFGLDFSRIRSLNNEMIDLEVVDWILITHEHLDHCDPETILQIVDKSPDVRIVGPKPVVKLLLKLGIDEKQIIISPQDDWLTLLDDVELIAIPVGHPNYEYDSDGYSSYVGYIINYEGSKVLHSGDLSLSDRVIEIIKRHGKIDTAFLPVNESNYFREKMGIIGNMTVREAFGLADLIGVKKLIPIHWDMFYNNETLPDEMMAVYNRYNYSFDLELSNNYITVGRSDISVIIRTLNEETYLEELLSNIQKQKINGYSLEIIIVDSGSNDKTLEIAQRYDCRILHISREEFSFGRSLNLGCEAATGDFLVMISGHCVPTDNFWLMNLCEPLIEGRASYSYGRQFGGESSHFSEKRIFAKYFPTNKNNGQKEYFCNNANSAIRYSDWMKLKFDEDLTGLEDLDLAKRLVNEGGKVEYVPTASVYHHHEESWQQVKRRFEREAIALQHIMPQVHVGPMDLFRYIISSAISDCYFAFKERQLMKNFTSIILYRWHQYFGVFKGNNDHRRLSHSDKEKYFYPN